MTITRSIALFGLAALFEIGGAWLIWQGWREHRGLWFIAAGVIALGAYGFVATFQPDPNFGRILAAYGGVFVAGSLAWGMVVDNSDPTDTTSSAPPSASSASRSSCTALAPRRRESLARNFRWLTCPPQLSFEVPPVARSLSIMV